MQLRAILIAALFIVPCAVAAGADVPAPPASPDSVATIFGAPAAEPNSAAPAPVALNAPAPHYHSLLFSSEEAYAIARAAEDYSANLNSGQSDTSSLADAGKDIAEALLQKRFYLSSIVYHSPDDWSIWLHDQQFTPDTPRHGDLRVESVSKEQVSFIWQPRQFSFYERRHPTSRNPQIRINASAGIIAFTLYPNQSFLPAYMRIAEGGMAEPVGKSSLSLPQLPAISAPDLPALPSVSPAPATTQTPDGLPSAPLPPVPTFGPKDSPTPAVPDTVIMNH